MGLAAREFMEQLNDSEITAILKHEQTRKIARYRLTDEAFRKKYAMTFQEFEERNIVAERGFNWEVEADSQEWETAIDGIDSTGKILWGLELDA